MMLIYYVKQPDSLQLFKNLEDKLSLNEHVLIIGHLGAVEQATHTQHCHVITS